MASSTLAWAPMCPCINEKNIAVSKFLVCVIKDKTVLLNCAVVLAARKALYGAHCNKKSVANASLAIPLAISGVVK